LVVSSESVLVSGEAKDTPPVLFTHTP